jgi:hypothetical protein
MHEDRLILRVLTSLSVKDVLPDNGRVSWRSTYLAVAEHLDVNESSSAACILKRVDIWAQKDTLLSITGVMFHPALLSTLLLAFWPGDQ